MTEITEGLVFECRHSACRGYPLPYLPLDEVLSGSGGYNARGNFFTEALVNSRHLGHCANVVVYKLHKGGGTGIIEVVKGLYSDKHLRYIKVSREGSAYGRGHVGGHYYEKKICVLTLQRLYRRESIVNAVDISCVYRLAVEA